MARPPRPEGVQRRLHPPGRVVLTVLTPLQPTRMGGRVGPGRGGVHLRSRPAFCCSPQAFITKASFTETQATTCQGVRRDSTNRSTNIEASRAKKPVSMRKMPLLAMVCCFLKRPQKKTLHSLSNRAIFTSGNNLVLLKHIETSDNTRTLFNPHSRTKPPPSTGLWCSMSAPSTRSIDFRARIHQCLDQRRSPHPLEHPVGSVWMLSGGPGDRRGEWLTFSRRGRRSEEVDP